MSFEETERKALTVVLSISGVAIAFLVWLIYFKGEATEYTDAYAMLPALNATLNGVSACCLVAGYCAIRAKRRRVHAMFMMSALAFSAVFLVSYIVYHGVHGDTKFLGTGFIRIAYFSTLISHIACTVFVLPMIMMTVFFAASGRLARHKKLARFTLPLWLYVSATGVAIYFLLKSHS